MALEYLVEKYFQGLYIYLKTSINKDKGFLKPGYKKFCDSG